MNRVAWASDLGSEFDAFLFAPIGEEKNGMSLSVVSALARLDVDPWQEAADLAGLPTEIAIKRLASLITALPGLLSAHLDSGKTAARLIALLPARASSKIASRETNSGVVAMTKANRLVYVIFFVMAVLATAQFVAASRQPLSPSGGAPSPATSGTAFPPLPPLTAGQ
jgi:hypothetical protein